MGWVFRPPHLQFSGRFSEKSNQFAPGNTIGVPDSKCFELAGANQGICCVSPDFEHRYEVIDPQNQRQLFNT